MGRQIQIAQADADEQCAVEWMRARCELLCLPRSTTSARPKPRALGTEPAQDQIIFLAETAPAILAHWVRCEPLPFEKRQSKSPLPYHLYPKALACIEWSRTEWLDRRRPVPGRYYLDTGDRSIVSVEQQRQLDRLMTGLAAWIRRTYPAQSTAKVTGRCPIFVGPGLNEQLAKGRCTLVHANGVTPVELIPRGDH